MKKTFRSSIVLRAVTMVMGHVDHMLGPVEEGHVAHDDGPC